LEWFLIFDSPMLLVYRTKHETRYISSNAIPETIDRIHSRFKEGEITRELLSSKLKGLFDKGVAREVDREEMVSLVGRAEEEGMVLQPAKKFPKPAEFLQTNFYAKVDPEKCTACGEYMCH
jgi:hypothetical protein